MNKSEKEFIAKNKDELIYLTTGDSMIYSKLVTRGLLSDAEVQQLGQKKLLEGQLAESTLLYDILMKKKSFKHLIEVLRECCERSGAADLLETYVPPATSPVVPPPHAPTAAAAGGGVGLSPSALILGSKACKVSAVVRVMENCAAASRLPAIWSKLAKELDVSNAKVVDLRQKLQLGQLSIGELLDEVFEEWILNEGDGATLDKLIEALKDMKSEAFAADLEKKFGRM